MQPAQVPGSLNLEYFLLRGQDWATNLHVAGIPHTTLVVLEDVLIFGMVLSLLMVVFIVYVMIRLHQVEHEGFHALESHVHDDHHEHGHDETEATHQGNDRWDHIVALATSTHESDWRRAILEADIMLFDVMRTQGYPGETVGEQLRMANPIQMTTLDLAWKAHKVRNEVAHGGESYQLSERDVRTTIDYYKRVFEEQGVV